jgi:hypothetical protein
MPVVVLGELLRSASSGSALWISQEALAGRGARVDRLFGGLEEGAACANGADDVLQVSDILARRSIRVTISTSFLRRKSSTVRSSSRPSVVVRSASRP